MQNQTRVNTQWSRANSQWSNKTLQYWKTCWTWLGHTPRTTKEDKLIILYKIINGLTPNYLSDLLPPLVGDNNPYSLRNANDIQTLWARTNLFFNSFFPSTIRAWNSLPQDIKDANTVTAFKYRLNRNRQLPPKYYSTNSRIGQILHARLRMACSSLNSHLYSKNIVPSPSCDVVTLKALIIFVFAALDILQTGTLTYMITYRHILLMTCYMVKKLQQMRRIK